MIASTVGQPTYTSRRVWWATQKIALAPTSGSKIRRDRLRLVLQPAFDPTELWRVQRGHLDHRDPDSALVMDQLAAEGIGESGDGSNIQGKYHGTSARFESIEPAGDQANLCALPSKFPCDCSAQASRCSRDHDNFVVQSITVRSNNL